jgi:hypothetical protein
MQTFVQFSSSCCCEIFFFLRCLCHEDSSPPACNCQSATWADMALSGTLSRPGTPESSDIAGMPALKMVEVQQRIHTYQRHLPQLVQGHPKQQVKHLVNHYLDQSG